MRYSPGPLFRVSCLLLCLDLSSVALAAQDRMERWRTELEELEQTLERREKDLVSYVDQLQGAMSGATNDAWWSRPAGGDGGVY